MRAFSFHLKDFSRAREKLRIERHYLNSFSMISLYLTPSLKRLFSILQVRRFNHDVTYDTVALTGMKFFYITRNLIVAVCAKVITYEMFLIQLHMDNQSESNDDFCDVKD